MKQPRACCHRALVALALFALAPSCLSAVAEAQQPAPARPAVSSDARVAKAIAGLRNATDSIIGHKKFRSATWSALIVDPEHGDTLYSHNAGKLLVPASNQKIVTAAVALSVLGPEFRFSTRVATSGVQHDSVLDGDLVVFGSGDPSFSDRIRGDAMIPLREMADSLRALGISRINGRLRRGNPVFTDAPIGVGWAWDDLGASYGATVGDLMFNDAYAHARVEVEGVPDSSFMRRPRYQHFLDAFVAAMHDRGVHVLLSYDWMMPVPDVGYRTLFTYQSAPLRDLLPYFTKPSQNQIGEILLKTLGLTQKGAGRADAGAAVIAQQLAAWGADTAGFAIRDGSGLSRQDYMSAETLVRALDAARKDSAFAAFYNALPIGAVDGTLDRRFHGTAAAGNVHAKTGSMERVRSLSGYVTTADGRLLEFSFIANGVITPGSDIENAFDAIVARLASIKLGL